MEEIIHSFIDGRIDREQFQRSCRDMIQRLSNSENQYIIHNMIQCHMLMTLAWEPLSDRTLIEEAQIILEKIKNKHYDDFSCFVQLSNTHVDDNLRDILLFSETAPLHIEDVNWPELGQKLQKNSSIDSLSDLLYNMLVDYIDDLSAYSPVATFNTINCGDIIFNESTRVIEEKLLAMLSYYCGVKPFYFAARFSKDGKVSYSII